ncbi:hypothetical protein JCM8547_001299 [Rhodosporidiobolus lusitaniae]
MSADSSSSYPLPLLSAPDPHQQQHLPSMHYSSNPLDHAYAHPQPSAFPPAVSQPPLFGPGSPFSTSPFPSHHSPSTPFSAASSFTPGLSTATADLSLASLYPPPGPSPSHLSHSQHPSLSSSSPNSPPPVGSIRCYWTLLSPSLEFVFLDPVLEHHLGEWAAKLVGTNLLDWVHPDEREQLREDLLPREEEVSGVESVGVFGSVTRCRYSRVVRVLRDLGHPQPPQPADAKIYAIDDEYLNLDLTTSWIAGDRKGKGKDGEEGLKGAVLAFFHATTDKDSGADNDAQRRSDWTNWCGPSDDTAYLTPQRCDELVSALSRIASSPSPAPSSLSFEDDHGPPGHVFQILDRSGRAIVTYPRSAEEDGGDGKRYDVEEFARLAREVMERPREAVASKTSCTRRYRSKHPVMKDGTLTTIESVVIMYGAITFACFQTGGVYLSSARKAGLSLITNGEQMGGPPVGSASDFALEDVPTTPTVAQNGGQNAGANGIGNGMSKRSTPGEERGGGGGTEQETSMSPPNKRTKYGAPLPPTFPPSASHGGENSQQQLSGLSIMTNGRMFRNTLDVEAITAGGISPTVATASAILGSFSSDPHQHQHQFQQHPPPTHYGQHPQSATHSPSTGGSSYAAFYNAHAPPPVSSFPPPPNSIPSFEPPQISYSQPPPPSYAYSPHPLSQSHSSYFSPAPHSPHEPPSSSQQYPLPPTSQPLGQRLAHYPPPPSPSTYAPPQPLPLHNPSLVDESAIPVPPPPPPGSNSGKKPPKQRPDGPVYKPNQKACESCGTVNSPEWRKGPTGAKSLCNACGLRYARSVTRQKKQAEAAANGTLPTKGKGKKKAASSKSKSAITDASSSRQSASQSPSTSSSTQLPTHSQPSPIVSRNSYDLSQYNTGGATPKPYTPYYPPASSAPLPLPGGTSYAHIPSPTTSQAPLHSPYPPATSGAAYFPTMPPPPPHSAPYSQPYSAAPVPTHSPLPPLNTTGLPPPIPLHYQHPHQQQQQHSPYDYAPTSAGGGTPGSAAMYATGSQGSQQSPHIQQQHQQQQQSYGTTYDWRHEQAEGGGQNGHGGEGGQQH